MNSLWWQIGPINRSLVVFYSIFSDDADFDFIINHHTSPASSKDSVGVVKCVLTLTESSVLCSHAAVLIKPQPPTKDLSKLTIEDPIPAPCHDSSWRSWCSVYLQNINHSIRIRGMIHAVSDAEHREQWCILDHSTTFHQYAPSNISAR